MNEAFSEARRPGTPIRWLRACPANWLEFMTSARLKGAASRNSGPSAEDGFSFFVGLAPVFHGWSLIGLGRAEEGLG